jgi:hypothetical protein
VHPLFVEEFIPNRRTAVFHPQWIISGSRKRGETGSLPYSASCRVKKTEDGEYGLVLPEPASHYAISAMLEHPVTNADGSKPLIIQYHT